VIDSLDCCSLPAGGRGAASPVAGGQDPVYYAALVYFEQITLFKCCQYSVGLELGLGLGLMYK